MYKKKYIIFLRWLLIVLVSICLLQLNACVTNTNKNQVVLSVLSDPKTFNAILSQESPNIFSLTYEGLITENPITGKKEPALAESWKISDDKLNIIFTLKKNLKWSDGEDLTVDDIIFTYNNLYLNKKIPNNYRDNFRVGKSGKLPIIRKIDQQRIEFKISEPFAPFLDNAQLPILPAHVLLKSVQNIDDKGNPKFLSTWGTDTSPEDIIVNGPFKIKKYITSQRIIFERNPYYWKKDSKGSQLPNIENVIWEIVESTDTALLQFRSGSLDSISVTPEYFSLLKREEKRNNFTIYNGGPSYGTNFMSFNLNEGKRDGKSLVDPIKSSWFNNKNFRKAIAYGINRTRIINNIYRGLGSFQDTQISIQSPYYDETIKGYDYDIEKSRELLRKEGFKYDKDSNLLDKNGNYVEFNLITNAGNKVREAIGAQIKEDLRELGIKVNFSPLAFNVLIDKLSNSLDWEANIIGFTGGNEPHSPNVWYTDGNLHMFNQELQSNSKSLTGRTVSEWEKRIEDLYVAGSQELSLEKRKEIYAEAQEVVSENLPFIYLVNPYSFAAVKNRFVDINYSSLRGAFWNIEKLSINDFNEEE